jgi:thiol-disulfide isomerase/thioredoxin
VASWYQKNKEVCETPRQKKYDVTFSKNKPEDTYKAVGVFNFCNQQVTGTFLTETGDYRFLEGTVDANRLWLSCFDGAHLFYFEATIKGDSLTNGRFYSGKHWSEPWEATINEKATLTDPETLTTISEKAKQDFQFVVLSEQKDSLQMNADKWRGKVTIVQLFGSWCPNCTDESKFFKELQSSRQEQGLQIIPVAFERGDNHAEHVKNVNQQFKELGITYPAYYGVGDGIGKAKAEITFPMLNHVMSFPTSIIIDKNGVVRKIHTGFYGPSTGEYYERYTARMVSFVDQLLNE